jgi:protoheme IX farnesyltransferase
MQGTPPNIDVGQLGPVSGSSVGDFVELLKPRVMSLVVFTALTGMVAAPGSVHPVIAIMGML